MRNQLATAVATQVQLLTENQMLKRAWDAIGDVKKFMKNVRKSLRTNVEELPGTEETQKGPQGNEGEPQGNEGAQGQSKNSSEAKNNQKIFLNGSDKNESASSVSLFHPILPRN